MSGHTVMRMSLFTSSFCGVLLSLGLGLAFSGCVSRESATKSFDHDDAQAIYRAAVAYSEEADRLAQAGRTPAEHATCEAIALWSTRVAESAVASGHLSIKDAYKGHLQRMERILADWQVLADAGRRSPLDVAAMRYHVECARAAGK